MGLFCAIFALAIAESFVLTSLAVVAARHLRLLDWPDKQRKLHARATPLMGGVAVILALFLGLFQCELAGSHWGTSDPQFHHFTRMLLLSAGMLCVIGLWDDKWGMRAGQKFLLQVIAILPFVLWGRSTSTVHLVGWHLNLEWLGIPLTLFWLVACTNFVNLVDGLDGLASTVSLIVSLTVAVLAYMHQLTGILCLALILSGALVGFLMHNWPPAKIFLGDSGSLPLGFLVGALAIEASVKKAAGLTLVVPFVLLSIPMFDTSMAILRRKLNGMTIGQGDRAHIHHCLRDRGLTPTQTLLAIGAMCLSTASAVVLAAVFSNDLIALAVCGGVLTLLVLGRVFGFNEIVLLSLHMQAAWSFLTAIPHALRSRFLVLRATLSNPEKCIEFWNHMVRRAERAHGQTLDFTCVDTRSNEVVAQLNWESDTAPDAGASRWELSYSVPHGPHHVTRIVATGLSTASAQPHRFNELLELFATFCPRWPLDAHPALSPDDAAIAIRNVARIDASPAGLQLVSEPHVLRGKWKVAAAPARPDPRDRRIENDAA